MKANSMKNFVIKALAPGATLLLLGSCPLTDQQVSSIATSAVTTGLNSIVSQLLQSLLGATGA